MAPPDLPPRNCNPQLSVAVRRLIAAAEAEEQLLVDLAEAVRRKDSEQTFALAAELVATAVPKKPKPTNHTDK